MGTEIDVREYIWFDLMKLLNFEPDSTPHYLSNIIDKCSLISGQRPQVLQICTVCNSRENLFEFKKKSYCAGEYEPKLKYEHNKQNQITEIKITKITKLFNSPKHKITMESFMDSLIRQIDELESMVIEPTGKKLSLFEIESFMFQRPDASFFVTETGEVTKSKILKKIHQIKRFIIEELKRIQYEISFTHADKTIAF